MSLCLQPSGHHHPGARSHWQRCPAQEQRITCTGLNTVQVLPLGLVNVTLFDEGKALKVNHLAYPEGPMSNA